MQIASPNATRRMFAAVIRAFAAGRLTNRQYDDVVWTLRRSKQWDDGCEQLFLGIWFCYCDVSTHRLTDRGWCLDPHQPCRDEIRAFFARCVLFLRNTRHSKPSSTLTLLSPFDSAAEFAAAKASPTFLYGKPSI